MRLKRIRSALLLLLAAVTAVFASGCTDSGEMVLFRDIADRVTALRLNRGQVSVYVDGEEARIEGLYMAPDLRLWLPASQLNDLLCCSTAWVGTTGVSLRRGDAATSLSLDEEGRADLTEAARALGFQYSFDVKQARADLLSPPEAEEELPARYDLREHGRTTGVRDQGSWGTCWAFASTSALESALLPDQKWDFSEDHLVNKSGFSTGMDDGGDHTMALAYFASWRGPVTEEEDPYGDGVSPDSAKAAVHVQDAVFLRDRDFDQIKRLVSTYGEVQTSIYASPYYDELLNYYNEDTASYYYTGGAGCNHEIDIIGWDDNYSRENFLSQPERDGAFLCKNSWGEYFGDNGYFYISYCDKQIGSEGCAYTGVEPADNYGNIYQDDLLGWSGSTGYNSSSACFAAVYQARGQEDLKAVSFYATGPDTWYDIYLVPAFEGVEDFDSKKILQSGYLPEAGYFTIPLEQSQALAAGRKFALIIDIRTEGAQQPVALEYQKNPAAENADLSDGETYMSNDFQTWTRLEDKTGGNACLKAFTDPRQQ